MRCMAQRIFNAFVEFLGAFFGVESEAVSNTVSVSKYERSVSKLQKIVSK